MKWRRRWRKFRLRKRLFPRHFTWLGAGDLSAKDELIVHVYINRDLLDEAMYRDQVALLVAQDASKAIQKAVLNYGK